MVKLPWVFFSVPCSLCSLCSLLNQVLVKVIAEMERLALFVFLSCIQNYVQNERKFGLSFSHPSTGTVTLTNNQRYF